MASPCYHGSFFTMKTSEEEGSHFRIPAFFGKFMDRVGRARAPISCLTFILTWSFLQDMCKLNDIHSRWCHQVTFFGGTKNQWWWNVMELHSWSFNRISVLKGNVFWWSFPTWYYYLNYLVNSECVLLQQSPVSFASLHPSVLANIGKKLIGCLPN